jgi:hypothetical protein
MNPVREALVTLPAAFPAVLISAVGAVLVTAAVIIHDPALLHTAHHLAGLHQGHAFPHPAATPTGPVYYHHGPVIRTIRTISRFVRLRTCEAKSLSDCGPGF